MMSFFKIAQQNDMFATPAPATTAPVAQVSAPAQASSGGLDLRDFDRY